jgi:predicted metal-dependent hydrolase
MNPMTEPDRRSQPQRRILQPVIPEEVLMNWLNCVPTFEAGQAALEQWQHANPRLLDPQFDADLAGWILEEASHNHHDGNVRADHVAGLFTQAVRAHRIADFAITLTADNTNMICNDDAFDVAGQQLLAHAARLNVTVTVTMTDLKHLDPSNPYVTDGVHTTTLKPATT